MAPKKKLLSAAVRKQIKETVKSPGFCVRLGDVDALFDVAGRVKADANTVWTFHVRIPLKPGSLASVRPLLAAGDVLNAPYPGIHFARIALIPRAGQVGAEETHLLLAVTFDESRELAINFLVANQAKLDGVLRHCAAYVQDTAKDPVALSAYLAPHQELVRLFYVKYRWPERVIEESLRLRARFLKLVRKWEMDPYPERDERLVYALLDFVVETQKTQSAAPGLPAMPVFDSHATNTLNLIHPIATGDADVAKILANSQIPPEVKELASSLSPITNVELFKVILGWGQTQVHCLRRDPLEKLHTLHFARISLIDEGSAPKMLFGSVFDGDLEQYIIDFSRRVQREINAFWGLCEDFPAKGCADLDAFRAWLEAGRVESPVFHVGHPRATVLEIEQSTKLREELLKFCAKPFNPAKLRNRLEKFVEKHQALLT